LVDRSARAEGEKDESTNHSAETGVGTRVKESSGPLTDRKRKRPDHQAGRESGAWPSKLPAKVISKTDGAVATLGKVPQGWGLNRSLEKPQAKTGLASGPWDAGRGHALSGAVLVGKPGGPVVALPDGTGPLVESLTERSSRRWHALDLGVPPGESWNPGESHSFRGLPPTLADGFDAGEQVEWTPSDKRSMRDAGALDHLVKAPAERWSPGTGGKSPGGGRSDRPVGSAPRLTGQGEGGLDATGKGAEPYTEVDFSSPIRLGREYLEGISEQKLLGIVAILKAKAPEKCRVLYKGRGFALWLDQGDIVVQGDWSANSQDVTEALIRVFRHGCEKTRRQH